MNFDDFYWHDSTLKSITIDRSNPGYDDRIVLEIDWYDIGMGTLTFHEVYKAKIDLNFGIIATESIFIVRRMMKNYAYWLLIRKECFLFIN